MGDDAAERAGALEPDPLPGLAAIAGRYMPVPPNVSDPPPGLVSPVPANSVPFGLIAKAPTAWVRSSGHAGS